MIKYNPSQILYVLALIFFIFIQIYHTVRGVFIIRKILGKMDTEKRKRYFDSHQLARFSTIKLEKFIAETENQPADELGEFNKKYKLFLAFNISLVIIAFLLNYYPKK